MPRRRTRLRSLLLCSRPADVECQGDTDLVASFAAHAAAARRSALLREQAGVCFDAPPPPPAVSVPLLPPSRASAAAQKQEQQQEPRKQRSSNTRRFARRKSEQGSSVRIGEHAPAMRARQPENDVDVDVEADARSAAPGETVAFAGERFEGDVEKDDAARLPVPCGFELQQLLQGTRRGPDSDSYRLALRAASSTSTSTMVHLPESQQQKLAAFAVVAAAEAAAIVAADAQRLQARRTLAAPLPPTRGSSRLLSSDALPSSSSCKQQRLSVLSTHSALSSSTCHSGLSGDESNMDDVLMHFPSLLPITIPLDDLPAAQLEALLRRQTSGETLVAASLYSQDSAPSPSTPREGCAATATYELAAISFASVSSNDELDAPDETDDNSAYSQLDCSYSHEHEGEASSASKTPQRPFLFSRPSLDGLGLHTTASVCTTSAGAAPLGMANEKDSMSCSASREAALSALCGGASTASSTASKQQEEEEKSEPTARLSIDERLVAQMEQPHWRSSVVQRFHEHVALTVASLGAGESRMLGATTASAAPRLADSSSSPNDDDDDGDGDARVSFL
ncbi:hypothetical protein FA09DRAFT_362291 [Tilletiopsis washingtonensis]|uniref:Uncharacterized protein n=1 Tax=Tilletiopsis washingtonensis TaxID=58919 RepID=A0A316Z3L0_9BASI|nr:hypothetical protein FA09DRAFT_362291 [Tilletiopsis washingtonensis]PWN95966.1 hypothetical protein FA09DRAFT_362291 [Tilletiopsis washingtonensis]